MLEQLAGLQDWVQKILPILVIKATNNSTKQLFHDFNKKLRIGSNENGWPQNTLFVFVVAPPPPDPEIIIQFSIRNDGGEMIRPSIL